jgi:diguanylate cyclase (GGDEF)-like protein
MYVNMKITRMQGGNRLILGISIIDTQMKQEEETRKLRQERIALGRIAALAGNYMALYMVDLATEQYVEYNSSKEYADLGLSKRGEAFFDQVARDAYEVISPEDLERHLRVMTRENMLREIRERGILIHNYRLLMGDRYVPLSLRATLVEEEDGEKLIIGVNRVFSRDSDTKESEIIYTHLAHALARGYTDLYYVDMDTDELIEFHTDDTFGVLTEVRRGNDFFEGCARDAKLFVHPEDQAAFVAAMDREFLRKELEKSRVFELTYRRIKDGRTFWVNMKVSRMEDDHRRVVIAVSDIDELVRQRREEERIQEERIIYARLHALTGNFIVVYVVDPETNRYREFSATNDYSESFAQATEGEEFFDKVREVAREFNHPDDLKRFLSVFTKKNVLAEVERSGIFTFGYRLMMEGKPLHVQMKAAMVEEKEGPRLIVGLNDIDAQVRQEEEYGRRLAQAQAEASIDGLTGVKNRHAYLVLESHMDRQIAEHRQTPFAIVMFDVNDLKKVNDASGHQAGDQYLRDASQTICDIFKHSPVFRVGGDEFAVVSQGKDYAHMDALLERVNVHNAEAARTGGVVIACGMSKFENDECVARVFERADHKMYENKNALKAADK